MKAILNCYCFFSLYSRTLSKPSLCRKYSRASFHILEEHFFPSEINASFAAAVAIDSLTAFCRSPIPAFFLVKETKTQFFKLIKKYFREIFFLFRSER